MFGQPPTGTMRFARFDRPSHSILPRLDAIGPERRIDPNAPLVAAWLGNRPVVLARPDPLTRRPGEPADLTVPITISRFRRALDIESGRATMAYEPSLIDDWPLTHIPIAGVDRMPRALGVIAGAAVGYFIGARLGRDYRPDLSPRADERRIWGGVGGAIVGGWLGSQWEKARAA